MILVAILALPLAAAALCWVAGNRGMPAITLAGAIASLALSLRVAHDVTAGGPVVAFADVMAVDALSALLLVLIALIASTAALFSWGYMAKSPHGPAKLRLYYASYNLFVFSMLAIPSLVEPTLVWIAVELTTLCSALLVSYEDTRAALEAAWKYVVLSLMGAAVALLGFLVLFSAMQAAGGGTYTWEGLRAVGSQMPPTLVTVAFFLILVGFGTKVGLVPMHTWLPDAHSQAPSPVCALLSGIETTAVLYVILRLLPVMRAAAGFELEPWLTGFGLLSVGAAAFLLLQVRDFKRLFAYSTVKHMGIILFAAGLGSSAAHYGALYQVVCHALTKSFCFFAAGATVLATGTRDIAGVRGLARTAPVAGTALLVGGLAVAGAPPFAVFLGEFAILRAGLGGGVIVPTALLVSFIAVGFFGILLHINRMVFGPAGTAGPAAERLPKTCLLALVVGATLTLSFGLYLPAPVHELLTLAAAALQR